MMMMMMMMIMMLMIMMMMMVMIMMKMKMNKRIKKSRNLNQNWIDTKKMGLQTEIGFIAQEVQEIIPEVIGINNDETLSIDYPKMIVVLTKAIQEQQMQIEELKVKIK